MRLPPAPELPRPPGRTSFPIVAVLAPVVAAVTIGLVIGSPFMLMFAALGPVIAIASVVDGRRTARRHVREEAMRFDRECALFERAIDEAHASERIEAFRRASEQAASAGQLLVGMAPGPSQAAGDVPPSLADDPHHERRHRMLARAAINPALPALIARGPIVLIGDGLAAESLARQWGREPGVELRREAPGQHVVSDATVVRVVSVREIEVREPGGAVVRVRPHHLSAPQVEAALPVSNGSTSLPDRVMWSQLELPDPAEPGALAIGRTLDGVAVIDLLSDGPHMIVGGTTGSGKSEFLRSLALSWAAAAPPERASVLFIDFKGGATFAGLTELPHAAGLVTDLDPIIAQRAIAALRAELRHRERVLVQAGVRDLRERPELLPRLLILVDEFATLVETFPELYAVFADCAARGRSLGVHVVLCTQHPASIVRDAIAANCPLRMSFRLTSRRDATVVPDRTDELVGAPAGRAALESNFGSSMVQVAVIDDTDIARVVSQWASSSPARPTWRAPLSSVIHAHELQQHADDLDALGGRPSPGRPLSNSPDNVVFGVLDDPENRTQRAARWVPAREGPLLVTGAARSGRTTALAALAHATAQTSLVWVLPHSLASAWAALESIVQQCEPGTLLLADDLDLLVDGAGELAPELLHRWDAAVRTVRAGGGAVAASLRGRASKASSLVSRFDSHLVLRAIDADEHAASGVPRGLYERTAPSGRGWWHGRQVQVALPPHSLPDSVIVPARTWCAPREADLVVVTRRIDDASRLLAERAPSHRLVRDLGSIDPHSIGPRGGVPLVARAIVGTHDAWQASWSLFTNVRQQAPVVVLDGTPADLRGLLASRAVLAPIDERAGEFWVLEPGLEARRSRWGPNPEP